LIDTPQSIKHHRFGRFTHRKVAESSHS
jgi:hypothetical protein